MGKNIENNFNFVDLKKKKKKKQIRKNLKKGQT